ncbi:MAG TPA: aminotransferase class I/II-fold pyridoxal phosphate-dependent enzyme [Longimicrobiales bacterium]|nr:aminotransferase class I/II-fold pyridoxal phosphate-dependent enzyme [Longimicrobiales bacterium]
MSNKAKRGTEILYGLIGEARQYDDAIILGRGDPDFDTPAHIIDAARHAMEHSSGEASPPEGILPLRRAISDRVARRNGVVYDPADEIVFTNGGQEALMLMIAATLAPGDEIIVPEPNYNTYKDAVAFVGASVVSVKTSAEQAFRTDPAEVRAALTARTKAILLVSPNNPAASVISRADQEAFIAIARERGLVLIADDIYDVLTYDGIEHVSAASLPGGRERTLTLNALSKTYAMTGWRTGWVTGPADLMATVRALKAGVSGPASIVAQYAALAALTGPQDELERMRSAYIERRRIVLDAVKAMGLSFGQPQGGQFVFVDVSETGMDSVELAQKVLREEHVLAYPGGAFSPDMSNFVRVTFLQSEDKLRDGMARFKRVVDDIRRTTGQ